jgi:hypothetical protein
VRRSTATSCRRPSSSAFLDADERPARTSQPASRMKIRYGRRRDTADHHALRLRREHRCSSQTQADFWHPTGCATTVACTCKMSSGVINWPVWRRRMPLLLTVVWCRFAPASLTQHRRGPHPGDHRRGGGRERDPASGIVAAVAGRCGGACSLPGPYGQFTITWQPTLEPPLRCWSPACGDRAGSGSRNGLYGASPVGAVMAAHRLPAAGMRD